ncbi:hypothetical protein ABZW30_10590 [Kitasatospora sp. NPDC004669]|uniref:hypothetical protein n=1 Tax=Kitasatospora sp. NPDC004669 TaxID=3154555 RepID=UPI0033B3F167
MEMTAALWSFVLVVGLLTLTPGLDTGLIPHTSALGRRRQALGGVLGSRADPPQIFEAHRVVR